MSQIFMVLRQTQKRRYSTLRFPAIGKSRIFISIYYYNWTLDFMLNQICEDYGATLHIIFRKA